MADLSPEEIKAQIQSYKSHMRSRGLGDYADDFAQESIIRILRGRKASNGYLFIDFAREYFGRLNERAPSAYNHLTQKYTFDEERAVPNEASRVVPEGPGDFDRYMARLEPHERSTLVLYFVFDLTMKEIGYVFDVSEVAISQRIKKSLRVIERFIERSNKKL